MRILLFFIWVTLGLVYFLIWNQRDTCCNDSGSGTSPKGKSDASLTVLAPVKNSDSRPESKAAVPALDTKLISTEAPGCLLFRWGKPDPIQKPCLNATLDSIVHTLREGQILEIIGEYNEKENQVMASGDLGLIRATKIKELLQGKLDAARIKTRSSIIDDTAHVIHSLFSAIRYRNVFMNEQIKELDDKTLIYFKYASREQLNNQLVVNYATYLSQKLKLTADEILLVGHTDDDATAEHNMNLGLQRAQLIKNLLMSKGIKGSRIKTNSKGETEPISPNDTEENRKLNRRVELMIVPPSQPK